jgi:hypothetical protein
MRQFSNAVRAELRVPLAVGVPTAQRRGWVYRPTINVDLEMKVATNRTGVAGVADGTDSLPGPNAMASVEWRRAWQVGIEVAPPLTFAMEKQKVAV